MIAEVSSTEKLQIIKQVLSWLRGELVIYPFDGLVELMKKDIPPEILPPDYGDILYELFPPDNPLKINIERKFTQNRLDGYRLCASDIVGIISVGESYDFNPVTTVMVKPKVPGSSLLHMLTYAFVPELVMEQKPQVDTKDISIVSIIILLYLYRLEQLVKEHGLQRNYIKREEELRGAIRGRCVLPDYLGRYVSSGKAYIVPCRFWELRIDSEPNRALRWGIEICRIIAEWLDLPDLIKKIEEIWHSLAPNFFNIPLVSYQSSQVRRLPRTGRFAPYESVYELLEFLLDNLSLDFSKGQVTIKGFAVKMWEVFEKFVFNILKKHMDKQLKGPQVQFGYSIKNQEGVLLNKKIFLDALLDGKNRLVLDTKWKEAIGPISVYNNRNEVDILEFENLRINNADLFQVVAYGRHNKVKAHGAMLIYPVLEIEKICRKRCILDFIGEEDRAFPIFLVGIPVGETLKDSIESFVSFVFEILSAPLLTSGINM